MLQQSCAQGDKEAQKRKHLTQPDKVRKGLTEKMLGQV